MTEQPSWKAVWSINADFLRAALGFYLAWLLWQMAVEGFELFVVFAVICALGGAKRAIHALIGVIKLVLSQRKWGGYRAQGTAPKADRLAREDDLRRRGLIR